MKALSIALLCATTLTACGPIILPVKIVQAPKKKATPPPVSAEETAGDVPRLRPLIVPALVPKDFRAPPPPADP